MSHATFRVLAEYGVAGLALGTSKKGTFGNFGGLAFFFSRIDRQALQSPFSSDNIFMVPLNITGFCNPPPHGLGVYLIRLRIQDGGVLELAGPGLQ